jgi:hypothetical protein
MALSTLGRQDEAEAAYREALRLRPDFADAYNNLGNALHALGRPDEAEASLREALRLRPDNAVAHVNFGIVVEALGRLEDAAASYREALRLRPDFPEALNHLGISLFHRPDEAVACLRRLVAVQPDFVDGQVNLSHALLLDGRFEEGWERYEWRWKTRQMAPLVRNFSVPLWSGEAIGRRTVLLHAEQGLGDTLQFCRYAPLMETGARVILEVQAPLVRLLSDLPGVAEVIARGQALPAFDLHCPLLSLPRAFGTRLQTVPAGAPYLAADPVQAAAWGERLAGIAGRRVGLVWAGEPWGDARDARRSVRLATLAPLAQAPGVNFVSLQKGAPAAQAADQPTGMTLFDFTADLADFADTAALIENLDLVISVDTSVAHLAGAMGKPVWLLNRFDTCWRWLLNRDDSPWYPTLRQFRQPAPGDWPSVAEAVRDALRGLPAEPT